MAHDGYTSIHTQEILPLKSDHDERTGAGLWLPSQAREMGVELSKDAALLDTVQCHHLQDLSQSTRYTTALYL